MILHMPRKTDSEAKFRHSQSGLSRILHRVEITDHRAKRPTMGGSIEPPFLLPQEDRTAGQTARHSTLMASFAHQGPIGRDKLNRAALSVPANTKETNPTTGDHHAEQDTRRRTVHRRKHRGNQVEPSLISQISSNSNHARRLEDHDRQS